MQEGTFKVKLNTRAFTTHDILKSKKVQMQVLSEPVKEVYIMQSKWWIVNMWRKFWNTTKTEHQWVYTVKVINDAKKNNSTKKK